MLTRCDYLSISISAFLSFCQYIAWLAVIFAWSLDAEETAKAAAFFAFCALLSGVVSTCFVRSRGVRVGLLALQLAGIGSYSILNIIGGIFVIINSG